MNISVQQVIFGSIIIFEVIILVTYDHSYFGAYIDVVILVLLIVAAYMAYQYFKITKMMPPRLNKIINSNDYQLLVERQRRSQMAKLMQNNKLKEIQKMKQSRQKYLQNNEDDDFIRELQQKQDQIFNFPQTD